MKVLIPTADYPPIEGGISSVTVNVARALVGQGHEVIVVAPRLPDMQAFDEGEPYRVVRYRGYGLGWFRVIPMLGASWPHVAWADVVLGINVASSGLIGYFGLRRRRTPYITFAYAYEFLKFKKNPLASALLRAIYKHAALTVAISTYTRDRLVEFDVPADGIRVIYPGAPAALPISADDIETVKHKFVLDTPHVILGVGRFIPRKGHITLVRAMPAVLKRHPDAVLVLVGRGPRLYETVKEANMLGVRNSVLFPGVVSDTDLAGLYAACEVFALPTGADANGQVEGFGLVFTEAHAYGKPVVAGRSGGVVDAVIDGETGLIVEPDDPDALAAAILSLMDNEPLRSRLGAQGKERVERELNWGVFTESVLSAFQERRREAGL